MPASNVACIMLSNGAVVVVQAFDALGRPVTQMKGFGEHDPLCNGVTTPVTDPKELGERFIKLVESLAETTGDSKETFYDAYYHAIGED